MSNAERVPVYQPEQDSKNGPVVAPVEGGEKTGRIIEFPPEESVLNLPEENKSVEALQSLHTKIAELQEELNKLKYNPSEKIRDILKRENILTQTHGVNVFDVKTFLGDDVQEKFRKTSLNIAKGKQKNVTKTMIFEALKDLSVVSREDYLNCIEEGKEVHEQPLFNVPDSVEDAFDLEKIKNKEYYLNYWDVFADKRNGQHPTWNLDMQAKNGDTINMKEFAFATKLLRDFQAQRNESGELEVFDSSKNEYVKLSLEWMRKNLGAYGNYTEGYSSPQQFLLDNCQNLLRKGLVSLNDFEIITNSPTSNLLRKEFFLTEDTPCFMAKGVKYYIGRKNFIFENQSFPINKIKITILNENTAGVVLVDGGREEVICVLDLLGEQERAEKSQGNSKSYVTINKDELNRRMHSWKRTDDNKQLGSETLSDYAKRMDSMADYGYIKKVTEDFALQKMGIHNLSWREQQWLVSAALELGNDYPRLLEFGKNYGVAGLKTFLSCEYGLENGKKILELGEKLSFEEANLIFAKYNEISDVAERNTEELIDKYFNKKDRNITEEQYSAARASLLQKSKDLLLNFSKQIYGDNKIKGEALMLELEKIKTDTIFFTSVFKNFAKNNPEASFEDFKGLSLETTNGPDFKEEDILKMISIAQKNYQEDEAMQKLVVESLQEGLQKEAAEFFVLRRDGEIMAFDRFDDEGEYFYVGSFNVDASYRGSAIGEVMMQESFDRKAKEKPLQGITDPKKIICSKYVEEEGFIINGILHTQFDGKELLEVEILRDDQKNKNYIYRSHDKLSDLFIAYQDQQKEFTVGASRRSQTLNEKRPFLMSFDQKEELEKFTNLADKLIGGYGYVITRYAQLGKKNGRVLVAFEQKLS